MASEQPQGPLCQSCAMPMQAPEQFGSEAERSPSGDYCRYCYQNGAFTAELTLAQMQDKLVALAIERKFMPEDEARQMADTVIPALKRWREGR